MRIMLSSSVRGGGGIGTVTLTLARGLAARGHEVSVLRHPDAAALWADEPVVAADPLPRGMDLNPAALWSAARALRRRRPDVLLALTKKDLRLSAPAARAMGVPVVVRHANDQPLPGSVYHRLVYGALPRHHVANSRATRDTILRSAPWLDEERVTVIHNGVDAARFAGAAPAELGVPPDAVVVGFLGRLEERKGILDLARAWPRVAAAEPRAHLVVGGRGEEEASVRALLASAPRVHWAGHRDDAPAFMRALDLFAMPSHWEGFGLVAAEALAAGVPVVASRVSSLPEVLADGVHGRLIPPGDVDALARTLTELVRDGDARARMGAAGRRHVEEEFSVERMIRRYEALFARLAAGDAGDAGRAEGGHGG